MTSGMNSLAVALVRVRRRSTEEIPAVRQLDAPAAGRGQSALGAIALDLDHRAGLDGVARPAAAQQERRRAHLERPLHDLTVVALDVDPEPRVRVHQLDFRD